jgi:hypothetical protein
MRYLLVSACLAIVSLAVRAASADPQLGTGQLAYLAHPRNLSSVAAQYRLSVAEIARLNGIADPNKFNLVGLMLPDVPSTRSLPRYVPWAPAPARQLCASVPWRLHAVPKAECMLHYCASGPARERVCFCGDGGVNMTMDLRTSFGAVQHGISVSGFNPENVIPVEVASVDLDADGVSEILVSWLTAVSNGIAAESRTLVVLKAGHEFVRYDSGEFTASSAAIRVGGKCHLAASHYENVEHALRGPALYLVERSFEPTSLRVDPTLVGRRCSDTMRFELPYDPQLMPDVLGAQTGSRTGSLGLFGLAPDGDLQWLRFQPDGSAATDLRADGDPLRMVDALARRIYPPGLVSARLTGKRAVVSHYLRPYETQPSPIVWLTPR